MSFAGIEPGTAALPPGPLQRQPRGQLRTLRGSYIASAILAVPDLIRTRALVCFEPHPSRCVTDAQPYLELERAQRRE